ncbi:MAG: serine protease [Patescibacteria group bacterium]|nr:serine protease [Patescibacteria group bacterium]
MRKNLEDIERSRNKKAFVMVKCIIENRKRHLLNECSGVVLDKEKGLILTCLHGFGEVDFRNKLQAIVVYGKRKYKARIIVVNFIEDIVVLKVNNYDYCFKEEVFLAKRHPKIKDILYLWSDVWSEKNNKDKTCRGKMRIIVGRCLGYDGKYIIMDEAKTLPGMSGSGVFNSMGKLIGIHVRSRECDAHGSTSLEVPLISIKIFLKKNDISFKES